MKIELKNTVTEWLNELRIFVVAALDNHVEKFCHRLERGEARLKEFAKLSITNRSDQSNPTDQTDRNCSNREYSFLY